VGPPSRTYPSTGARAPSGTSAAQQREDNKIGAGWVAAEIAIQEQKRANSLVQGGQIGFLFLGAGIFSQAAISKWGIAIGQVLDGIFGTGTYLVNSKNQVGLENAYAERPSAIAPIPDAGSSGDGDLPVGPGSQTIHVNPDFVGPTAPSTPTGVSDLGGAISAQGNVYYAAGADLIPGEEP
jgi:hypothetical protein